MMDFEWLRRLIRLVEESDIDSLEVERLTTRVRIRKSPAVAAPAAAARVPAPASPPPSSPDDAAPGGAAEPEPGPVPAELREIHSPMVGTFYRSPSPDAPPFVAVGDRVERGQTLCVLEAMKLMNELESEVAGVVREIAVENAEPVEFGQLLFRIEAD